ncbi:hypothetical protein Dacet_0826 [Denitrovibrio acetiphilus DSM 12809]|uniref:Com family DNA-binding transcriptional regulator n=1 Tax=Denitrovibrio acetiphilus (strain DSM 12809 / NBRC 114555 / N2460) TaxID=522772 RepID=D4H5I6_DENA2|nr:Com family DNA-binding transcriptional regulator [Denitrovibrio acetiphilus]ADD67606.1 hypothetical protein Dacet_0826 [Denitrovibrio acetiphilus DSM 12809]
MNCNTDCTCIEIRCKRCKRLLMKGVVKNVEIKCPKCGYIQMFEETKLIKNSR